MNIKKRKEQVYIILYFSHNHNFFVYECFYMNMIFQMKELYKYEKISFEHCYKEVSFLLLKKGSYM